MDPDTARALGVKYIRRRNRKYIPPSPPLYASVRWAGLHRWDGKGVVWHKGLFRFLLQRREAARAS
jgi:hypothetical protein